MASTSQVDGPLTLEDEATALSRNNGQWTPSDGAQMPEQLFSTPHSSEVLYIYP